ncbi:MAG: hypothetical protein GNW80_15115 [Asgard group archaeon]|nr:hypothetical protein [Asgard group archaeon]
MSRDSGDTSFGYPFFYVEESLDENKRSEIIISALIGVFLLLVFGASISLAIIIDVLIFTVIATLVFSAFIISLVFLIGYVRTHNRKKRTFARMLDDIEETEEGRSAEELQQITEDRNVRLPRPEIVVQKKKKVKTYRAKQVQYKDQNVLGCPKCQTLFHYEHLFQWLTTKNSCPVCGEEYVIKN